MWKPALIGVLLLTGCVKTVGSADAICSIPKPQLDLESISTENLLELDLYAERLRAACEGL
jgi:hypothetical protein